MAQRNTSASTRGGETGPSTYRTRAERRHRRRRRYKLRYLPRRPPGVNPGDIFHHTHTPAIPLARAIVADEDGISCTRPGRALKWSDPGTLADTRTQEFLECQTLPEPVEGWEEVLHFNLQEMEEMLGPAIDMEDITCNLFAPGEDWVEAPQSWRVHTQGRRILILLEEQIQNRQH